MSKFRVGDKVRILSAAKFAHSKRHLEGSFDIIQAVEDNGIDYFLEKCKQFIGEAYLELDTNPRPEEKKEITGMFRIGDKVKCIDMAPCYGHTLTIGGEYTVAKNRGHFMGSGWIQVKENNCVNSYEEKYFEFVSHAAPEKIATTETIAPDKPADVDALITIANKGAEAMQILFEQYEGEYEATIYCRASKSFPGPWNWNGNSFCTYRRKAPIYFKWNQHMIPKKDVAALIQGAKKFLMDSV